MRSPRNGQLFGSGTILGYGVPGDAQGVTGEVRDKNGAKIATGTPIDSQGGLWILQFKNIPVGSGYSLRVKNSAGETWTADNLTVGVTPLEDNIIMTDPTDSDNVVTNPFTVYGTTTLTTTLVVTLTPSSGNVTFLYGPPNTLTNWAFKFDNLAVGDYTVKVCNQAGTICTQAQAIVVGNVG
jgi:hypothetical protein